ncbi:helix-turn-helix domain-containing protein [Megamonas hypermegale]|uniref:helix-turn-helix domain-containing protein n=1 Tax=Megamonas hypermegale TaxID=158847 RepID=UPI002431D71D|nr:helix-turn-helix transcriptional regulator [Megamonas hypermegale]
MSDDHNIIIGKMIAKQRKKFKKTQQELAKDINSSLTVISKIELGKKDIKATELFDIAKVFNLPIEYFNLENKIEAEDLERINNLYFYMNKLENKEKFRQYLDFSLAYAEYEHNKKSPAKLSSDKMQEIFKTDYDLLDFIDFIIKLKSSK